MSTDLEKDTIINKIYYDKAGNGSINRTHKAAKVIDKTISIKYVSGWFDKNVGKKGQPRGTNSFVAPYHGYEYQFDLFFINDLEEQKFTVGCCCIDIFSKYAAVVAIQDKKGGSVASGLLECFKMMGKKPELLYTDDETSFSSYALVEYYKENNIKHYITRNHSAFAERFIRTFKDMLYKRIDGGKKENPQWHDYIFEVLLTYNNQNVHSSTKKTPENARKSDEAIDVKTNLELIALTNRKYPPQAVGDNVKILKKRKPNEKERVSRWSIETFKVKSISKILGQEYYKVEGENDRDYIRGEILKV